MKERKMSGSGEEEEWKWKEGVEVERMIAK